MNAYLIGCDIGTTSAKATLINLDGEVLGNGCVTYGIQIPEPNFVEQDPDTLLISALEAIKIATEKSNVKPSNILAICFSGQAPGCVPINKDIIPLRFMHTYLDRRGEKEANWILNEFGEEYIFKITGNYVDPYYGGVKILWELINEPSIYQESYKFLSIKDYIIAKTTGWIGTDFSNASLFGVFFDIHNRQWIPEIINHIKVDLEKLPIPVPCTEIIGVLSKNAAHAMGLKEGTPVVAGTVDSCASMLSAGVIRPGQSAISLGTSADWGFECTGNQFVPRTICLSSAANPISQHLIIATVHSSGGFLRWFRDLISPKYGDKVDYLSLDEEAANSIIGANGLIALSHMAGKATPKWHSLPHSGFLGLTLAHNRGDITRAIMESVGYALRENRDWLNANGLKTSNKVGLIGGGFRSYCWAQIICDILGIEGLLSPFSGEPALGDAVIAGVGIGAFNDASVVSTWFTYMNSEVIRPKPINQQKYNQLYDLYKRFEEITQDLSSELALLFNQRTL